MLTTAWVSAIIMLFILTPVAKLTRRFIYAMVEQYDRGDPADQGASGVQRGVGSITAAGSVAVAGLSAMRGMIGGGGGSGGSAVGGGTPSSSGGEGGGGKSSSTTNSRRGGDNTSSDLARRRDSSADANSGVSGNEQHGLLNNEGTAGENLQATDGSFRQEGFLPENRNERDNRYLPSRSENRNLRSIEGEYSQSPGGFYDPSRGPNNLQPPIGHDRLASNRAATATGANLPSRSTRYASVGTRASAWSNVGRRTLGVLGGASAIAAGMGVAAVAGPGAGNLVSSTGIKAFTAIGGGIGRAAGTVFHGAGHFGRTYRESWQAGQGVFSSAKTAFASTASSALDKERRQHVFPINTSDHLSDGGTGGVPIPETASNFTMNLPPPDDDGGGDGGGE